MHFHYRRGGFSVKKTGRGRRELRELWDNMLTWILPLRSPGRARVTFPESRVRSPPDDEARIRKVESGQGTELEVEECLVSSSQLPWLVEVERGMIVDG